MRTLVLTLATAFALSAAAAAQTYGPSSEPSPSATTAPTAAASAAPAASGSPTTTAAVVHMRDFAYVPETVTVAVGQPVQFIQDDATPHTVTASDKSYDSGNLDQRATWSHAFTKPGTYTYTCAYHPNMKGTIVVK